MRVVDERKLIDQKLGMSLPLFIDSKVCMHEPSLRVSKRTARDYLTATFNYIARIISSSEIQSLTH
jgi:hypothetical protein